jgi:hypothetical protein
MFLYSAILLKHELSSIYRKTSDIAYVHDIESDNYVNNMNVPTTFGCDIFTPLNIFSFSYAPPRLWNKWEMLYSMQTNRPFTNFIEDNQFAIRKTEKILKMQYNTITFTKCLFKILLHVSVMISQMRRNL